MADLASPPKYRYLLLQDFCTTVRTWYWYPGTWYQVPVKLPWHWLQDQHQLRYQDLLPVCPVHLDMPVFTERTPAAGGPTMSHNLTTSKLWYR